MLYIKTNNYNCLKVFSAGFTLLASVTLLLCNSAFAGSQSIMITVAKGFGLSLYASDIGDAKQMAMGANGTLFVGSNKSGTIHALVDSNQDGRVDKRYVIAKGLESPDAIAFHNGDLFVATENQIVRFVDIEQRLRRPSRPKEIYSDLPYSEKKSSRAINFGPDGRLYVSIGAPCNVCEAPVPYSSIIAINVDTGASEQIAAGVRDASGFDWSPIDKKLWFADQGRDWMGDNLPPDEINRIDVIGSHYGFPYLHASSVVEPAYEKPKNLKITLPMYELPAHVAPTGLAFYRGSQFPDIYHNQLFVAENGSWNRSSKVGYQVVMLKIEDQKVVSRETVVSFLDGEFPVARPFALLSASDGAMYISDDLKGNVYRLFYKGDSTEETQELEENE
ncbi:MULTISPECIES: PQQ-dependent sugar dehydrogenase [Shewanella]|jgi:glucose/arabinose dehydrogenase|uniref:PQQ-dependent sugar dehydrogenase n=1 Tax=Shewanella oncorhynchi TaxID=2726434 RepID=A0AA50KFT2_9GAMM|nr:MULTISPECIES: PQQ-dependent sugar dehydrogenase [Shewanella]RBP75235.1 glucose/arabinose dehydrogenase [Shewanella putrefaciens]GCF89837.1 L-sorbosone dehydrogenase [Shewanella sp. M-Br]AVI66563.1 L-sorbosone dehydrogenase [Shewanella sp. WE21]MBI1676571.1 PQQ-dependent sugar dehydrogenase [Shewanella sp. DW31]MBP6517667.1 PQQ-dependent sugar dehydrogenase [Shewanella sp.]